MIRPTITDKCGHIPACITMSSIVDRDKLMIIMIIIVTIVVDNCMLWVVLDFIVLLPHVCAHARSRGRVIRLCGFVSCAGGVGGHRNELFKQTRHF